ncbi:hypothetical protein LVJ94_03515 [Pendulispora rubella]|uniref:Cytochrome c domain-containing protein n=1 Tax=Pendulispora rubella TaxID=2741070 RepID=A0ABZ2L8P8_9BACT
MTMRTVFWGQGLLISILTGSAVLSACGSEVDRPHDAEPQRLSQTGLYADIAGKRVAPEVLAYSPSHHLWSDGADKKRWVLLPPGARIDTSDMDHWRFPIGTKFFKEFGHDGRLLETRLIEHVADTGNDEVDYRMTAFLWRSDQSEADAALDGAENVHGTEHDVPSRNDCFKCHIGDRGKALGFSAIQLARTGASPSEVTLSWLAAQGKLTVPPPADADFSAPGDETTAAALGYLHANCGHCHNENGLAWPDTPMVLRLSVAERDPHATKIYETAVGVPILRRQHSPYANRIAAGHAEESGLVHRMSKRGTREAMPPIASEEIDPAGIELVTRWIAGL